ncbi:hypothetical protein PoB_004865600 [Plakobranchus ocellatus]|uniref:Uncharacterized protein n=1 Tax=Plakobranchus ocellatus TaxID=259542 RepID=A0AAV4BFP8_9GAST|nr:hypothetical protein PoB_004865600 [Plakobranchus ocellatus]
MTFNFLSQLTDRSKNKEDEDEGSPVDDVGVETDDESDVNLDVEEGEVDGLRLDSSDDDESEYFDSPGSGKDHTWLASLQKGERSVWFQGGNISSRYKDLVMQFIVQKSPYCQQQPAQSGQEILLSFAQFVCRIRTTKHQGYMVRREVYFEVASVMDEILF